MTTLKFTGYLTVEGDDVDLHPLKDWLESNTVLYMDTETNGVCETSEVTSITLDWDTLEPYIDEEEM